MKQQRLDRLFAMSRLGENLRQMTFESFLTNEIPYDSNRVPTARDKDEILRKLRKALSTSRLFANELKGWLILLGGYGCGKTHLAAAVANECISRGEPALFQVVPDLLDHLRATFAPSSLVTYDQLFEEVRSAPVLILDDLGAHSNSPWAEEKLFQIINHRYNCRLPTVITTNYELEKLDPRLASRMTDMGPIVDMHAPDFRGGVQTTRPALGKLPPSLRGRGMGER